MRIVLYTVLFLLLPMQGKVAAEDVSQESLGKSVPEKVSVAVLEIQGEQNEADLLRSAVEEQLVSSGSYVVLERVQMQKILEEQGLQTSGACTGESCAVEAGKLLGAKYIVVGSLTRMSNGQYKYQVKLVDVEKGAIESMYNYSGRLRGLREREVNYVAQNFINRMLNKPLVSWDENRRWYEKPVVWGTIAGVLLAGNIGYWVVTKEEKPARELEGTF